MIYWILISFVLVIILLAGNNYKKKASIQKKLTQIKDRWAKPKFAYRNFDGISRYLTTCNIVSDISAGTGGDLDIEDLFSFIDRTNSKPGQQYLYKKIHCLKPSESYFERLEEKINRLTKDPEARAEIELKLSELSSNDASYLPELYSKTHTHLFHRLTELYIKLSPLLFISLVVVLSVAPNGPCFLLLLALVITNMVVHYLNKNNILKYTHSLPQLLILSNISLWLAERGLFDNSEAVNTSLSRITKLRKSLSIINFQTKVVNDPTDVIYLINEWFKMVFLAEPLIFLFTIKRVNLYLPDIKILYEAVAEIDMCISIQSVREGLPYYCLPEFNSTSESLTIKDLYHPLVEGCVANSISSDNKKVVLITGSNMSGKTTFIRSIAVNTLLAQAIHTCTASTYQAPPLKILTSIHMSDDLDAHKSYFQAEAIAVLDIINQSPASSNMKSLVIIDEIFRGTNTIERIAAAMSVLTHLIESKNFVFVSTHDLELAELLGSNNTVYSFEELIKDDRLVFDYKIKEGVLKNRDGIAVLQRLGYPQTIIDAAFKASKYLREKYEL